MYEGRYENKRIISYVNYIEYDYIGAIRRLAIIMCFQRCMKTVSVKDLKTIARWEQLWHDDIQDADFCQQEIEKLVSEHDKCLTMARTMGEIGGIAVKLDLNCA
jgi:hypothetical protein